ncbi:MAG TPA: DUF302 domain-containing protein [Thioploca sp.]|nr:DUF302 domain-containing protein [Thioploca sp.]
MKYIVESEKSVQQASIDLQAAVTNNKFGILHTHDLQATLNKKGFAFKNACKVFEVCNPKIANDVLTSEMDLNMLLPCRISIWEENNQTKIGMVEPTALLALLSNSSEITNIASEVNEIMKKIINEAS